MCSDSHTNRKGCNEGISDRAELSKRTGHKHIYMFVQGQGRQARYARCRRDVRIVRIWDMEVNADVWNITFECRCRLRGAMNMPQCISA